MDQTTQLQIVSYLFPSLRPNRYTGKELDGSGHLIYPESRGGLGGIDRLHHGVADTGHTDYHDHLFPAVCQERGTF